MYEFTPKLSVRYEVTESQRYEMVWVRWDMQQQAAVESIQVISADIFFVVLTETATAQDIADLDDALLLALQAHEITL